MTTILVVDDEAPIREILAELLQEEGYRVLQAPNGREALALIAHEAVGLVISDVMMPVLDGASLCRTLKAAAATATLPIILLTATGQAAAASAGADAVLDKPFDLAILIALVKRCLADRH